MNKSYIHTFSNWFEDPNFFDEKKLKKIEETNEVSDRDMQVLSNSENSIKQMKEYYESLGEEGLLTYANWQRAMLKIIIESMRICYSGWSRDYSSALSDSSPTKIVEREQLNCVGRTAFMLIKILEQLGIKGYLASQWYHVACLGKFADGKEMLIEPSGMKGEELSPATEIKNNDNVLAKGERIIEVVTFSDGEVIKTRFLITGSKRIAISALSNYVAGLKENTDLKNFVYQQAITSSDIFNLFSSNADSSLSDDEIYILIRKFQLLEPDYFDFNSRQKILVITSAHERAEKKIRKYWDKVIEKYGPLI